MNDVRDLLKRTFLARYRTDSSSTRAGIDSKILFDAKGVADLFETADGASFNKGLYRLHNSRQILGWTAVAEEAFPTFSGRVRCFASDWLGRQFALDIGRKVGGEPTVLMLEPGSGQALEIPRGFLAFHAEELVNFSDAALAESAFIEWIDGNRGALAHENCVGYIKPLFLGGSDVFDNMEIVDMRVYWHFCAGLLAQVRMLESGNKVSKVRYNEGE